MTGAVLAHPVEGGVSREVARLARGREALLAVAVAGTLALVIVQPWIPIPFPVYDFGWWLHLFASSDSTAQAFRALVAEHAQEGRVNVLSLAYVAVNWGLFEGRVVGWQVLRALILLGVIGSAFLLFRSLGARAIPALVGATFFVITDSARSVWFLPQAIEHVAALLVLIASLLASGYYRATHPGRSAAAIAALLVLAIWVREPMVAAVPFVVLLALSHEGAGRLTIPRRERRSVLLVSVVAIAVAVFNVIPVIAVRFVERSTAYASRFGPENLSLENAANVFSALMLPVTRVLLFPANALFVLAIVVAALGRSAAAARYRWMVALAATLPLCAAAIYVMWPSFPGNYAFPYVPAGALMFALALTRLWESGWLRRALAVGSVAVIIGYGTLLALNGRREYAAARALDADAATFVSERSSARLVVAVDDPRVSGEFGRGLAFYATATEGRGPADALDVECGAAERLVTNLPPATVLMRPDAACPHASLPRPTTVLTRAASIRDWKTLRPIRWETTTAFWHDASGR